MKTIEEWIEMLPETEKQTAIENIKKHYSQTTGSPMNQNTVHPAAASPYVILMTSVAPTFEMAIIRAIRFQDMEEMDMWRNIIIKHRKEHGDN